MLIVEREQTRERTRARLINDNAYINMRCGQAKLYRDNCNPDII